MADPGADDRFHHGHRHHHGGPHRGRLRVRRRCQARRPLARRTEELTMEAESNVDLAEVEETQVQQGEGVEETEQVTPPPPPSPYDKPGDWYVIHSYAGYENKVKANLESRIQSMHMEDRIYEVHIPMEDVVEFKGGKKVTVPKKVFPGYLLVRMTLDDDSWYAVRNTPGVTGFVAGNAQKPTPLSRREVERFLGVQPEEEKAKPRFKPEWEVGEQVRVGTGPFADFNGVIEEINIDQQKVRVLVNIFGRDTPIELGFDDIQKN
ncbi:MAG: transcription termination/antitermination protein NusG [Actinobacteria bacterium]|nr:transcription termination/antitermination protein NusG [Actinomycetota bacterium]